MFIVLPLHRESLRQMMRHQGRVNHAIKIRVMEMLKEQACGVGRHGDIKDCWFFKLNNLLTILSLFEKPNKKPENILVDYDLNDTAVSNFRCYLADWGSSGDHLGGTPMYAGPRTYEDTSKDLFSCGRLALELFLQPKGKVNFFYKFPLGDPCFLRFLLAPDGHKL